MKKKGGGSKIIFPIILRLLGRISSGKGENGDVEEYQFVQNFFPVLLSFDKQFAIFGNQTWLTYLLDFILFVLCIIVYDMKKTKSCFWLKSVFQQKLFKLLEKPQHLKKWFISLREIRGEILLLRLWNSGTSKGEEKNVKKSIFSFLFPNPRVVNMYEQQLENQHELLHWSRVRDGKH